MTPREIMLAQFARAMDPSSAGRQMPGHYGVAQHNILSQSSPVATQVLHAVGIALAAKIRGTEQVAVTELGEGVQQPGRLPRGAQLRRHPQAAGRLRRREQRLRHQRPGDGAERRRGHRHRGLRATTCPASSSTARTCSTATAPVARRSSSAARRRADAHRGQGHPADGALVGRPADEVPERGGARGGQAARPAAALPGELREGGHARRRDRGTHGGRGHGWWSRTPPTGPRRSPSPTPRRPSATSSSSRGPDLLMPIRTWSSRSARPWPTRCGATRR